MLKHWPQGLQIGFPYLIGPIQGHKSSAFISNLGQIEKIFFSCFSLDSLGLISTFSPLGMLDLSQYLWILALTPCVNWAFLLCCKVWRFLFCKKKKKNKNNWMNVWNAEMNFHTTSMNEWMNEWMQNQWVIILPLNIPLYSIVMRVSRVVLMITLGSSFTWLFSMKFPQFWLNRSSWSTLSIHTAQGS